MGDHLPLNHSPWQYAADGSRAVREQVDVWGRGPVWEEEEAAAGPRSGKGLPPADVEEETLVQGNGGGGLCRCGTKVDHSTQEGATCGDDLGSEAQRADEGQQLVLCALDVVQSLLE